MAQRRSLRYGLTLVEVLLALAIGMVVIAACYEFMFRARQSADTGFVHARLDADASDLLHRVADLLRQASVGSPDWALSDDGSAATYNLCEGAAGGSPLWSAPRTLAALPMEGDAGAEGNDGIDNDADGFVDEQQLVIQDPDTGAILEVWIVNLQSFQILRDGRTLTITLTLQMPSPELGAPPETGSATTSVSTRN